MKTKNAIKRISSLALCLAVCAAGLTGLTVSAATESSIDFSKYSTDTEATNALFESKLSYYFNSSDSNFDYMTDLTPTDAYADLDVWANPVFGQIDGKSRGFTVYDRIGSMSPKDSSGKLVSMKNSYVKLSGIRIGNNATSVNGAVWIGLRQQTPGKFIDGLYEFNKDQIFVRVTNTGITVASGEELNTLSGSAENAAKEDYEFDSDTMKHLRTVTKQIRIEVTLVGSSCRVFVGGYGCPENNYSEAVSDSAPTVGYVSFGMGDTGSYAINAANIKNLSDSGNAIDFDSSVSPVAVSAISVSRTVAVGAAAAEAQLPAKVTVLDKNGNKYLSPVIWDTTAFDSSKPGVVILNGTVESTAALPTEGAVTVTARITVSETGNEAFTAAFKPYSDSLGDSFLTTWSHEKTYQSNINFTDMFANGWSNYTERKYSGNYPFRTDKNGEISSRIAGLTPIDANGKAVELRNFELTFDYRVPLATSERCGAVWVGFHQKEAGHFTDFNKNQSFARITNTGITIASGSNVSSALHGDGTEDISMSAENTAWLAANGSLVTVKVKAVGNTCTVGVYKTSGEELLTYTESLDITAVENGYLTLGIADRQIHMINLTVKRLDESGKAVDFTEYTKGDVNGDGRVDLLDLVRIKKYEAKVIAVTDIFKRNADCTLDGAVDVTDIAKLRQILIELV